MPSLARHRLTNDTGRRRSWRRWNQKTAPTVRKDSGHHWIYARAHSCGRSDGSGGLTHHTGLLWTGGRRAYLPQASGHPPHRPSVVWGVVGASQHRQQEPVANCHCHRAATATATVTPPQPGPARRRHRRHTNRHRPGTAPAAHQQLPSWRHNNSHLPGGTPTPSPSRRQGPDRR